MKLFFSFSHHFSDNFRNFSYFQLSNSDYITNTTPITLIQKIKEKRKQRGYSQDHLADLIGMTSSAYSKIERGETRMDVDRLKQIAEALQIDMTDFFVDDTMVIIYNADQATGNNKVAIQPLYKASDEGQQQLVMHLQEEVTVLRRRNDRLLQMIERLIAKSEQSKDHGDN